MYQKFIKRSIDFLLSLMFILIASPIFLIVAFFVRTKLGSPVIFKQERPGYQGNTFMLYKFRTMNNAMDSEGRLLPDSERLTKFGKMLRSTSLDEIPEFFNILKGDMSFIGPRPLLGRYLDLYSARQNRRHEVLPGLTGWAQVNGRNAISWEEKFEYDIEYVEHVSFLMDMKIIFMTIGKVLARAGINAYTSATMDVFQGTVRRKNNKTGNRKLHLLFSNVGKRVELVQTFLYAADNLDISIQLFGSSTTETDPGLIYCHKMRKTCDPEQPGYIREMLSICKRDNIDLIIPYQEREMLLFATYREEFENIGTQVLVSEEGLVNLCDNKKWTRQFFEKCKVQYTEAATNIRDYRSGYPCIIEALDDKDNIVATRMANSESDVHYYLSHFKNYLIRPFVQGQVYIIDCFCDFEGNPVYITPRMKEEAGINEVSKFRIVQDEVMIEEAKKILEEFRPRGPLTIKLTKQEKTGVNYYIRLEPRFDDAVPVSIRAGADSPRALLNLLLGNKESYKENAADNEVIFSRFEQSVCLNKDTGRLHEIKSLKELADMDDSIEALLFDLDDTLYSQKDYLRSGYRAIAESLPQVKDAFNRLCVAFEKGQDPIKTLLKSIGEYSEEREKECWEIVYQHTPNISLYEEIPELFKELHKKKKVIGIITDGDPKVQNAKIDSLGLRPLVDEILITDELAGNGNPSGFHRPNDLSYLVMKKRLDIPCRNMAWVGDDKNVDFIGPNKLGMHCYWYRNEDALYGE